MSRGTIWKKSLVMYINLLMLVGIIGLQTDPAQAAIVDLGYSGPCYWGALNLASPTDDYPGSSNIVVSNEKDGRNPGVYVGSGTDAGLANVGAYKRVSSSYVQSNGYIEGQYYNHRDNEDLNIQGGGIVDGGVIKDADGDDALEKARTDAMVASGILDTYNPTNTPISNLDIDNYIYPLNATGDYLFDITGSLDVKGGGTFRINAPPGSQIVIRTGGYMKFDQGFVDLQGGITASDVIWYSENKSSNVDVVNSTVYGIFFVPRADFKADNFSTIYGEVIVGGYGDDSYQLDITNGSVIYTSTCRASSVPLPGAVWLLGTGLLGLGALGWRRKRD